MSGVHDFPGCLNRVIRASSHRLHFSSSRGRRVCSVFGGLITALHTKGGSSAMWGSQAVPSHPGQGPREMGLLLEFWILSKTLLSRVVLPTCCSVGPLVLPTTSSCPQPPECRRPKAKGLCQVTCFLLQPGPPQSFHIQTNRRSNSFHQQDPCFVYLFWALTGIILGPGGSRSGWKGQFSSLRGAHARPCLQAHRPCSALNLLIRLSTAVQEGVASPNPCRPPRIFAFVTRAWQRLLCA